MKKKTIGIILIFMLVIMLGIGITYAYFSAQITGNENTSTINFEAGSLEIELNGGNSIVADSILPDSAPFATKTFIVKGNNDSNGNMPYNINIVVDNNTYTDESIKYSISGVNNSSSGKVIPDMEMKDAGSTTIIGSGYFERGNPLIHTYTLKVYFPETGTDQSENMRATYSAHIEVTGEEAEEPAPNGWWKAESGTLLAAIRDNSTLHIDETGMTKPGQDIATTDEQLRITTDDYGVSFYYRGAVENNYVVFANKCWRIVRVTGDGSIKLILHNNDAAICNINDNTLNFAKYNGTNYSSIFNTIENNNRTASGVGFMYGDMNANNYLEAQANIYDSIILTRLKAWYDFINESGEEAIPTFTSNEKNMLADVIWCNDKSLSTGVGYGNSESIFATEARFKNINNANITLICPNIEGNTKLSKFTAYDTLYGNGSLNGYKIGLLTGDEAAFAGGIRYTSSSKQPNNDYYLYNSNYYWLLSPFARSINLKVGRVFFINDVGGIGDGTKYVASSMGIRPSIALIPSVQATYDKTSEYKPGTVNNPYVVSVS